MLAYANHSRFNDRHDWGNLYDHLMSMAIFTLIINKTIIRALKIMKQMTTVTICIW